MNALRPLLIGLLFLGLSSSFVLADYPDLGPTFFSPQLSPDGNKYLWESLERGGSLWLSQLDGSKLEYVARGHSPSWEDKGTIKFERTLDDGHEILERSLYRMSLDDGVAIHLADTENPDYQTVHVKSVEKLKGPLSGKVFVLDPGHGKNTGVYSKHTSTFEDYYALKSAIVVRDYLVRSGATVKMTRLDNTICPSLSSRVNFSNSVGAVSYCSIHYNGAANTSAHGMELLYRSWNSKSKYQATKVHDSIREATGIHTRGVKGDKEVLGFYLGVLSSNHKTNYKCLTEGAFITNKEDAFLVHTEEFNENISYGIYAGLCEVFGVEPLEQISVQVQSYSDGFDEPTSNWVGIEGQSVEVETPTTDGIALLMEAQPKRCSSMRYGAMGWADYQISAFMRSSDEKSVPYGLLGRCTNQNELSTIAYVLAFDEATKQATLYAALGDSKEMVPVKNQTIDIETEDGWNLLEMRCNGTVVTASVNGAVLEAIDVTAEIQQAIEEQLRYGKVGVFLGESSEGAAVLVDEFKVEPIPANTP